MHPHLRRQTIYTPLNHRKSLTLNNKDFKFTTRSYFEFNVGDDEKLYLSREESTQP
jgi:hypothetical protein